MVMVLVHLDKIAVVGPREVSLHHLEALIRDAQAWRIPSKLPYGQCYSFPHGACLQIASEGLGVPDLRFEFNPSHGEPQVNLAVLAIIADPRLTRVDVAVDYDQDLGLCQWLSVADRCRAEWFDRHGRLTGLQIGKGKSDLSFRVYNKAREQRMEGPDWWRAEAR